MKEYERLFRDAYKDGLIVAEYNEDEDEFDEFSTCEEACEHIASIAEEVGICFLKNGEVFASAIVCHWDLADDETVIDYSPNLEKYFQ